MSSIKILKFDYIETTDYPISLLSYIISIEDNQKYIIFKFNNNLNQKLISFKYEVSCYDSSDSLVERDVFVVTPPTKINGNTEFVPLEKLSVTASCESIKVLLVEAKFENSSFLKGRLVNNNYITKDNNPNVDKDNKEEEKKVKGKDRKEKSYNVFKYRNIFNTKSPKLLKLIFSLVLLISFVLIAVNLYFYSDKYSTYYKLNGLEYEIISDKCYVADVYDDKTSFNIPETITINTKNENNTYSVAGIGKEAFLNSKIKTLTLNSKTVIYDSAFKGSNLTKIVNTDYITEIGKYAFANTNIETFEAINCTYVSSYAFSGCSNLSKIYLENATLANNALNDARPTYIEIKDTYGTFESIFDINHESISIDTLRIYKTTYSAYYFDNISIRVLYVLNSSDFNSSNYSNISYIYYMS